MAKQELVDYIKQCLAANFETTQISDELTKAGWAAEDIAEAMSTVMVKPVAAISSEAPVAAATTVVNSVVNPIPQVMAEEIRRVDKLHVDALPEATKVSDPANNQPVSKKPGFKLTFKLTKTAVVVGIVSLFVLIGAGAAAYFYYFPSPERVLSKMRANLNSISSLAYAGKLEVKFKVDSSFKKEPVYLDYFASNKNLVLQTSTASSTSNKLNDFIFNFTGQTDFFKDKLLQLQLINYKASSSPIVTIETRLIGGAVYLNPNINLTLGSWDLSAVNNQWLKIDNTLDPTSLFKNGQLATSIPAVGASSLAQWTNQGGQIKDILFQSNLINIEASLPSAQINNVDTYHYSFSINNSDLGTVLAKSWRVWAGQDLNATDQANLQSNLAKVSSVTGEIWIGKADYLPRQLTINLVMKSSASEVLRPTSLSLTLTLQNFNQPVTLTVPQPVKTVAELLAALTPANTSVPSATSSSATSTDNVATSTEIVASSTAALDQALDSDHDGLTDYQEINIYHTDPLNVDTDGDGYLDGAEVKNGYNPNGPGKLLLAQ